MTGELAPEAVRCPECGAPPIDGLTCSEQLGMLLSWEYDDAELRAEHFLTVAVYNLQHPAQFTDAALAGLRESVVAYLDRGLDVREIRRRTARQFEGATRVLKEPSQRHTVRRDWSMTIADVYIPDRPHGAAARVRAWGTAIRRGLD